jgi:hypothetical protein
MRKRQIIPTLQGAEPSDQAWLDMDRNVLVEVTSEEIGYPIESALLLDENENCGWRAANPGTQIIRVIFDESSAETYLAGFRGHRKHTHARVRPTMVAGYGPFFPRNRTPAVELQPVRFNPGDRRLLC